MKKIIIVALLFVNAFVANSQDRKIRELVDKIIATAGKEGTELIRISDLYKKKNPEYAFKYSDKHIKDSSESIRLKAAYIIFTASINSKKKSYRTRAVKYLLEACKFNTSVNMDVLTGYLKYYKLSDFDDEAKDSLDRICRKITFHYDKLVMIAGLAEVKSLIPFFENQIENNTSLSSKYKWGIYLALARMGHEPSIDFVYNAISQAPVNSDIIYDLVPDILYSRRLKCINPVIDMLFDEEERCMSSNPDNPQPIMCGYRIMEYLAPVIKKYPLKYDEDYELLADDYEKALKHVRKWMTKNRSKLDFNFEVY